MNHGSIFSFLQAGGLQYLDIILAASTRRVMGIKKPQCRVGDTGALFHPAGGIVSLNYQANMG